MAGQAKPLSISDVLSSAKTLTPRTMSKAVVALSPGVRELSVVYPKKAPKERDYIEKRFAKIVTNGDRHQKLFAATVLHEITNAYTPLPKVAKWLTEWDMDLTERYHAWHGFMALPFDKAHKFSPYQHLKLDRHARRIYARLLSDAETSFASALGKLPAPQEKRQKIALSVAQFLGPRHAPTAAALRMAKRLVKNGYDVKIFNLRHTPSRIGSAFFSRAIAHVIDTYDTCSRFTHEDGKEILFWQNKTSQLTRESFEAFVEEVRAFAPDAWISLGPGNLYSDLLAPYIPSIDMPMTSTICIGQPGAFGCVQPLSALAQRLLAGAGVTQERIVPIPNGIVLPETGAPIDRHLFGLKPDDFAAALVTNRPAHDLPPDYLAYLEEICARVPKMKIRIFGSRAGAPDWRQYPTLRERMQHVGFVSDLPASLAGFDAVLNPPRQGGGTSAAFAMALGIPVYSLGNCDVATLVGDDFIFPDLDTLADTLIAHGQTGKDQDLCQKAKARWTVISDLDGQLEKLIKGARLR